MSYLDRMLKRSVTVENLYASSLLSNMPGYRETSSTDQSQEHLCGAVIHFSGFRIMHYLGGLPEYKGHRDAVLLLSRLSDTRIWHSLREDFLDKR
ncbi:hypothetical protein T265_04584 [Opisthorchis viverrini]|uniref:Uncharacterized protein n=1 Tax=Opisthorchis viverrini TaxID=6198 RepID=A0A074ZS23_OPIVI|nr:hypothetical protein T265_04584 [Opisthorchis viverrini]KER28632.1 hypothetical protein T265_04584 [Opisthorchis viverrini]